MNYAELAGSPCEPASGRERGRPRTARDVSRDGTRQRGSSRRSRSRDYMQHEPSRVDSRHGRANILDTNIYRSMNANSIVTREGRAWQPSAALPISVTSMSGASTRNVSNVFSRYDGEIVRGQQTVNRSSSSRDILSRLGPKPADFESVNRDTAFKGYCSKGKTAVAAQHVQAKHVQVYTYVHISIEHAHHSYSTNNERDGLMQHLDNTVSTRMLTLQRMLTLCVFTCAYMLCNWLLVATGYRSVCNNRRSP
jgi:hypothetical protein